MNNLNIRKANACDAQQLTDLALRSKAVWGYDKVFMAECADELRVDKHQVTAVGNICYVATLDKKVVGYYSVAFDTELNAENEAELEALFIEPDYLGLGIGKQLFLHAISKCQEFSLAKLHIQADPNAETFYIKVGAKLIGKTPSLSIKNRFLPQFVYHINQT